MKKHRQIKAITFLIIGLLLSACATLFKGTTSTTYFSSKPAGAQVYVNGKLTGNTPLQIKLKSKGRYTVEFRKAGYGSKTYTLQNRIEPVWIILDALSTGLIGIVVDAATGAWYTLEPNRINIVFSDMPESDITKPLAGKIRDRILKTSVVEFAEKGDLGVRDAGSIIADWMTTALDKTGAFEVYERLSLRNLIEEYKLGMTGLIDVETAAKIGRMRGVQAIVTGSVIKFGDVISVTAKLIDSETAKILATGDVKVYNVNEIPVKLDRLALELAKE